MVLVFLAPGFEEAEAVTPTDILRRAGVDVKTVGIGGEYITGSHGITLKSDLSENEALLKTKEGEVEMAFLPGGMPGVENLLRSNILEEILEILKLNDKYMAAICAAPVVLAKYGCLDGKEATCYPGFENRLTKAKYTEKALVRDGKIITARAMGTAPLFGFALAEALKGQEIALQIRKDVLYD